MRFTDIFIRRPVLATVISLLILLVGLRSLQQLNVREFPETQNAVVTVSTVYTGADADLVKGFITTPLEKEIASANGIDYLESTSIQGLSTITAHLELDYDPNDALTEITSKVNAVRSELPEGSEDPTIDISIGQTTASMYLSFYSDTLQSNEITDYLTRVVQPKFATVGGVQEAAIIGAKTFAMRVWLKPQKMAALNITPSQVSQALAENNFLAAVGQTKGLMVSVNLSAATDLHTEEQFRRLVVKRENGAIIRLGDVADVVLGAEDYNTSATVGGRTAIFMSIEAAPTANVLTVIEEVRRVFDQQILPQLPAGLKAQINYDATEYITESIDEVVTTLAEALVIVIVVIFLFLGSIRAVVVPAVAIPLSLVGAGFIMLALGYSINLLTLLAMVLAIGMVVDDAIIVVENIDRHIGEGMQPREAALKGARELGGPVIAMTITLLAVYAPIGFLGGITGALFSEFAFTLAGAVLISGVVALTLSPMMCSKLLRARIGEGKGFAGFVDRRFGQLRDGYQGLLHRSLDYRSVIVIFGAAVLASCYFLYESTKAELAPTEDQGFLIMQATGAPNASIDQIERYTAELNEIVLGIPETDTTFVFNGVSGSEAAKTNTAIAGMILKPYSERERSQMEVQPELQAKVGDVTALQTVAFSLPPLPGTSGGLPVQFVVGTTEPPLALYAVSEDLLRRAWQSGLFAFVDTDLKFDRPQVRIRIDRDMAADLGLEMRQIGRDLASMLSANYVNRFSIEGRSYKVIPQVGRQFRLNAEQLERYYVRTDSGELIPLSTVVSLEKVVEPQELKRFQQLNSATISGVPAPGVTLGQAIAYLQAQASELFPKGYSADYAGQSRQYVEEGAALVVTFVFAIIIIFLVLAAQFESFRDPLIMLVSVPMSIFGALLFLALGFTTINIYTQVGLVTLIGLISKHGILIVQFANQLQREEGMSKREAIEAAAAIRLRPVLMTTAAIVIAVVPLLLASGAGAESRFAIGLVISTGMTIGTAFTLFVVPAIYTFLGADHAVEVSGAASA